MVALSGRLSSEEVECHPWLSSFSRSESFDTSSESEEISDAGEDLDMEIEESQDLGSEHPNIG